MEVVDVANLTNVTQDMDDRPAGRSICQVAELVVCGVSSRSSLAKRGKVWWFFLLLLPDIGGVFEVYAKSPS